MSVSPTETASSRTSLRIIRSASVPAACVISVSTVSKHSSGSDSLALQLTSFVIVVSFGIVSPAVVLMVTPATLLTSCPFPKMPIEQTI